MSSLDYETRAWLKEHGLLVDMDKCIPEARAHLERARVQFGRMVPYYLDLLHMLSMYWVPYMFVIHGSPMGVTNQMVLLMDPGWVCHIADPKMLAAVLWHEVEHINRGMERIEALPDKRLANIAGDLAINWYIRKVGVPLPSWVLYPEQYKLSEGLSLEEYYAALELQGVGKKEGGGKAGKGEAGKGKPGMTPDWQPTGDSFGSGKCGSAAGGSLGDIEGQANKEKGCSATEKALALDKTRAAIKRHVAAHGRGSVPAGLVDQIEMDERPAVVPWRTVLRSIITHTMGKLRAGYEELSWSRPSLHSLVRGQPRPGFCSREPDILLVRDTSGSMGHTQLQAANREAVGIMRQLGVDSVWFMDVDAKAYEPVRVRLRDIPKLNVKGRGGTSFKPAFAAAERLRPRPELVIYLTDGDGDAPDRPPRGMSVVWCIVPTGYGRRPAEWGNLVLVDDEQQVAAPL